MVINMISFSGIDCSGKSTHIEFIKNRYDKEGIACEVIWSRGGYTPILSYIKKIFLLKHANTKKERLENSIKVHSNPKKRKLLFLVSLIDLWFLYCIIIRFKELSGVRIICDRYIWDSYIDFNLKYPEYNLENSFLWTLILKTIVKPKVSYLLLISAEESIRRSAFKNEPFPEPIDIRNKRIMMYIKESTKDRWKYIVDASGSIEDVFLSIWGKLKK